MIHMDFVMNLPHQYYPAIGEFMFRCAQLEMQMHEIAWRATNIDNKQGRTLTIGADSKVIRGILGTATIPGMKGAWIPDSEKAIKQEINYLREHSKPFVKLRNRIAHGSWQSPVDGKHSEVQLLAVKEQDEKYYARFDPSIDDAHIHQQCKLLKALNLRAKALLIKLHALRGMPLNRLHSAKNVS